MNKKAANLTVVKDAQPDATTDFTYTTPAAGNLQATTSLDEDARCPASSRNEDVHGRGQSDFGAKSVTEPAPAGWSLTPICLVLGGHRSLAPRSRSTGRPATTSPALREQEGRHGHGHQGRAAERRPPTSPTPPPAAAERTFKLDDDEQTAALAAPRTSSRTPRRSRSRALTSAPSRSPSRRRRLVEHRRLVLGGHQLRLHVDFTVDPGDTITCTYVNKKDATVTVIKDAQPERPRTSPTPHRRRLE